MALAAVALALAGALTACGGLTPAQEKALIEDALTDYAEELIAEPIAFDQGELHVEGVETVAIDSDHEVLCRVRGRGHYRFLLLDRPFDFELLLRFDPDLTLSWGGWVLTLRGRTEWPRPIHFEALFIEIDLLDRALDAVGTEIVRVVFDTQLGRGVRITKRWFGEPQVELLPLAR